MNCRPDCGACCIAPSISSPIPGMPDGKPAGVVCVNLDAAMRCRLFGLPARPVVCEQFAADVDVCGNNREEALSTLRWMEVASL